MLFFLISNTGEFKGLDLFDAMLFTQRESRRTPDPALLKDKPQ
jgi:hypothetical protein